MCWVSAGFDWDFDAGGIERGFNFRNTKQTSTKHFYVCTQPYLRIMCWVSAGFDWDFDAGGIERGFNFRNTKQTSTKNFYVCTLKP